MGKGNEKKSGAKLEIGAVITEPGSSARYKTGSWRNFRPVIDQKKCIKCHKCWLSCPDSAIRVKEDGSVFVDYDYCKGCLICMHECPAKAIEKEVERK